MSDIYTSSSLPALDDMLQSLLLIEEGEHEFSGEEENIQELRQLFFPITRNCVYLNHASDGPLPRPVARTLYTYIDDTSNFGNVNFARWLEHERGAHRRMASMIRVRPDQVAMTASTGDGLMMIAGGLRWQTGDMARYCHERGIICGIDAAQALGALDIDVQALGIDYLAAVSHKWLLGPLTTGILYVADDLLAQLHIARQGWFSVETPFDFFNYEQPLKAGTARFEHSSPNSLPIIGLNAALGVFECIDGGMAAVEERISGLTSHAISGLERLGYPVVSPQGEGERSGIVCFKLHPEYLAISLQQLVDELALRKIHVAARSEVVRISPHFYNTLEEIDVLLNALDDIRRSGKF